MGHALFEPLPPTGRGIRAPEFGLHPYFIPAKFDRAGRHIVRPKIEGAAAREIKSRVVPVADQNAVLDVSTVEWEAHMGTAVVQGKDSTPVFDDQNGAMRAPDDEPPFALEFLARRLSGSSQPGHLGAGPPLAVRL